VNVNKQRHERGKHGQTGEINVEAEEERRNSQQEKHILARGVRCKSPARLLVALPDTETKNTCRQQKLVPDTPTPRGLSLKTI